VIGHFIARGSFGQVSVGKWACFQQVPVAIKEVFPSFASVNVNPVRSFSLFCPILFILLTFDTYNCFQYRLFSVKCFGFIFSVKYLTSLNIPCRRLVTSTKVNCLTTLS
jgi:hypothetical protein